VILARLELTILCSASIRLIQLGHRTTVNNLFKKKKKNYSDDWFRSSDFWVMGPTRSLFATSLPPHISSPPYATLEGFEPSLPMGIALAGQRVNYSAKVSRSFHHLLPIYIHRSLDLHHRSLDLHRRSLMVRMGFEPMTLALLAPRSTT
jgi:hypothetical protein